MNHAMIDVEALRLNKPFRAPLMEVGVVVFNDKGEVIESLRILVKKEGLPKWASVEKTTLDWWEEQDYWHELQRDIMRLGISAEQAMHDMNAFLEKHKVGPVWFAGPQYDQVMLEAYLAEFGIPYYWRYNDARDFRTIRKQYPVEYETTPRGGVHEAVADCLFQVSVLRAIYVSTGRAWL